MGRVSVYGAEVPHYSALVTLNILYVRDDAESNFKVYERFEPGLSVFLTDEDLSVPLIEEFSQGDSVVMSDDLSAPLIEEILFTET